MSELIFKRIIVLFLFWIIPLLILLYFFTNYFFNRNLKKLNNMEKNWVSEYLKEALLFVAIAFIIFALAGPAWNKKEKKVEYQGRDVLFLIDVSNSMLAKDLYPNRLGHAKFAIKDTIEILKGDRVAIVAFAGNTIIKSPLTNDYYFLMQAIDELSPENMERGGTMLGHALKKSADYIFPKTEDSASYKDIILICDGEDQGSNPVAVAKELGDRGIRLIVIGLGDDKVGTRIPIVGEDGEERFLTFEGKEVWTKLDSDMLRNVAQATPGGKYLNVKTGSLELPSIYNSLIKGASKRVYDSTSFIDYDDEYQIFLFFGVIFLIIYFYFKRGEYL